MSAPIDEHGADWAVDQQLQSPLFGLLPAEVRLTIFQLALGPHCEDPVAHDFRLRHDHADPRFDGVLSEPTAFAQFTDDDSVGDVRDSELESGSEGSSDAAVDTEEDGRPFLAWEFDDYDDEDDSSFAGDDITPLPETEPGKYTWARPDTVGVEKVNTAILRTCRRAYLEASDGTLTRGYVFRAWVNASSPPSTKQLGRGWESAASFPHGLTADQRNSIVSARLFCNTSILAPTLRSRVLRRIEHLRITLIHDPQRPYACDPFMSSHMGGVDLDSDIFQRSAGFGLGPPPPEAPDVDWAPPVEWGFYGWATALRFTPRLRELVVDFDASEETRDIVAAHVEWAVRAWRFPLWSPRPDGCTYLSAAGNPIRKTSWRGFQGHFPDRCPHCNGAFKAILGLRLCECPYSNDRLDLIERGVGPRMYTWTLRWTPRVGEPWVTPFNEEAEPDGRWKWEEGEDNPWGIPAPDEEFI